MIVWRIECICDSEGMHAKVVSFLDSHNLAHSSHVHDPLFAIEQAQQSVIDVKALPAPAAGKAHAKKGNGHARPRGRKPRKMGSSRMRRLLMRELRQMGPQTEIELQRAVAEAKPPMSRGNVGPALERMQAYGYAQFHNGKWEAIG